MVLNYGRLKVIHKTNVEKGLFFLKYFGYWKVKAKLEQCFREKTTKIICLTEITGYELIETIR